MTTNFPYNDVLAALVELSRLRSEHAAEPDADVQDAIQVDVDKLQCLLRQEFSHNPLLNHAVDRYLSALARGKIQAGKEHHVVPQLYLRHFRSDPGGPTGSAAIWVFDVATGQVSEQKIARVAVEANMYRVPKSLSERARGPLLIEWFLQFFESTFAPILASVLATGTITPADRPMLALFIASQSVRSGSMREQLQGTQQLSRPEAAIRQGQLILHGDLDKFAAWLADQIWVLARPAAGEHLYTSDEPIVGFRSASVPLQNDISSLALQIEFPLSYNAVFRIFDRSANESYQHLDGRTVGLSREGLRWCNALQVCFADDLVCASQPDFAVAKTLAANQAFYEGEDAKKGLCRLLLAGANPL
jgi:hypothetical protein